MTEDILLKVLLSRQKMEVDSMSDFEEVRVEYRACIESIGNRICYQSKEVFETYEEAWSYLREHIPDGYEGYVISLPKLDINLEVDRKWD